MSSHTIKYTMMSEKLYKMEKASPMLRCIGESKTALVLTKVHQGTYNSHIGGWALGHKLLKAGYYWPILMKNGEEIVIRCDEFPKHSNIHQPPTEILHSVTLTWPFYQGHGHTRFFSAGSWPTKDPDCWSKLLHKVDKCRGRLQNQIRNILLLLLAANHNQKMLPNKYIVFNIFIGNLFLPIPFLQWSK